jgi:hypothetical protein
LDSVYLWTPNCLLRHLRERQQCKTTNSHWSLNLDEKISGVKTDKDGKIRQESEPFSPSQNKRKNENDPSSSKTEVKWFFVDYPQQEVVEICREFLDLIREFVDKVHKKFP